MLLLYSPIRPKMQQRWLRPNLYPLQLFPSCVYWRGLTNFNCLFNLFTYCPTAPPGILESNIQFNLCPYPLKGYFEDHVYNIFVTNICSSFNIVVSLTYTLYSLLIFHFVILSAAKNLILNNHSASCESMLRSSA